MRILSKGKQRRRRLPVVPAVLLSMATFLGACGGDSIVGPAAEACGPPPYFTVLPVTEAELSSVPVFGGNIGALHFSRNGERFLQMKPTACEQRNQNQ